ncbi:hypothetical protein IG631_11341 [Alternaria alternata]|jgi:hypothetical protein|nr:hypothetical protein IG631_11341 [Alternaria alternata]
MGKEVLSPRTCGMVAGRVVRGGFIQIIQSYIDMRPGTGVQVPDFGCICRNRSPKVSVSG